MRISSSSSSMEKEGMRKALEMVHLGILWVERTGFLLFFLEVFKYRDRVSSPVDDLFHQLSLLLLFLLLLQLGRLMCCYLKLGAKEEEFNLLLLLEEDKQEESWLCDQSSAILTWSLSAARAMENRVVTVERIIFVLERLAMLLCRPLLDGVLMVLFLFRESTAPYNYGDFMRTLLTAIAGFSLAINAAHLVCFLVAICFMFVGPKLLHDTTTSNNNNSNHDDDDEEEDINSTTMEKNEEEERRRGGDDEDQESPMSGLGFGNSLEGWEEIDSVAESSTAGRDPLMRSCGLDEEELELSDRLPNDLSAFYPGRA